MKRIIAFLLVVFTALSLFACAGPEKAIVGTWSHQSSVLGVVTEITYTFNEDGTGTKSNVIDIDFTYSFSDDKLLITTSTLGIENTEEFFYELSANKLVLRGKKDTIEFQKVK